jgi:hypothetical protein
MAARSKMSLSKQCCKYFSTPTSIAPLAVFRIAFGTMMALAVIRFWYNGWIEQLYIKPSYFFTYYGFDWIQPLQGNGMYLVFTGILLSAIFIALGLAYRISTVVFFLLFTYIELTDKTTYLNHYYFISIVSFLLCVLPAHQFASLDVRLRIAKYRDTVPGWMIFTLQLQMAIVYFFAGIAKINSDWLLHGLPLRIWLPYKNELPVIGPLLTLKLTAFLFSWVGMLFDCLIAFFLFNRRTVWYAYAVVVIFHVFTAILFPAIGVFPFVMIVCAGIFLPEAFHERLLNRFKKTATIESKHSYTIIKAVLLLHFTVQFLIPVRYLLYPGNLFWTEQGYRFSWRVMLMEKAGDVTFHIKDSATGNTVTIHNRDYLTPQQEKQMSTQPDMILQFAHHLANVYTLRGFKNTEVYAEGYVTLNGKGSRLFIRNDVNLAAINEGLGNKWWILP